MGPPPSDFPDIDFSASRPLSEEPIYLPPTPSYRLRPEPLWRYVILFTLTIATTTYAGSLAYASYYFPFSTEPVAFSLGLLAHGLWYSFPVIAILGAHEFGHYFACRYYRVDASLPYFLPLPLPFFSSGTLGAVIRIRQRIPASARSSTSASPVRSRGSSSRSPCCWSACTCRTSSGCRPIFAAR